MKRYELNHTEIIKEPELYFIHIYNKVWMESYKDTIQLLIHYFNDEYTWDGMFTLNDVENRIKEGHNLFILYVDKRAIGYVWFREIDKNTCFGYNLYVTKKIDRPKWAAKWFYNKVSEIMLKNYKKIKVEIEDWNGVVIDMVKRIGYKEI